MSSPDTRTSPAPDARQKLLGAALTLVRTNGYAATSVADLCAAAGVTKGAFFHHFASKDALAVAAAHAWTEHAHALFSVADYHRHDDPLDRLLAYIDLRRELIAGEIAGCTCFAGTMTQEIWHSSPAIRDACRDSIVGHAVTIVPEIEAAVKKHGTVEPVEPRSLALHIQAVLQGAFILAKATQDLAVARDSIDHLKRYVRFLFKGGGQE